MAPESNMADSTKNKSPSAKSPARKAPSSGKKKGAKSVQAKSSKTRDVSPQAPPRIVTMLDPPAMENLYYIAHNAVGALELRGFGTVGGATKKKKRKGGKKTKKK